MTTETHVTRRPVIQQTRVHDYLYGRVNATLLFIGGATSDKVQSLVRVCSYITLMIFRRALDPLFGCLLTTL